MSLNATVLKGLIKTNLLTDPDSMAVDNPALDAFCEAIAAAVVLHITSAATLAVVTTCPAGGGTGTGTVG
jgi:hypothetical protein